MTRVIFFLKRYISLEILKDWINLIDDDGWVAREQILGEEARSKVRKSLRGLLDKCSYDI